MSNDLQNKITLSYLEEKDALSLAFAPVKELRSIYRFLRLVKDFIDHENLYIPFHFFFSSSVCNRMYDFPFNFKEFELIVRDQGETSQKMTIFDVSYKDNESEINWLCELNLKTSKMVLKGPPDFLKEFEEIWKKARETYGLKTK
ncbi:MAG: hypothetical protein ACTSUV_03285 [Candidatus Ranarchaeia archaeon]